MYICWQCGVKIEDDKRLSCPKCGARVAFKKRPPVSKSIKTD